MKEQFRPKKWGVSKHCFKSVEMLIIVDLGTTYVDMTVEEASKDIVRGIVESIKVVILLPFNYPGDPW